MIWLILEARAEICQKFTLFFGQWSFKKNSFEIYWPLETLGNSNLVPGRHLSWNSFFRLIVVEVGGKVEWLSLIWGIYADWQKNDCWLFATHSFSNSRFDRFFFFITAFTGTYYTNSRVTNEKGLYVRTHHIFSRILNFQLELFFEKKIVFFNKDKSYITIL